MMIARHAEDDVIRGLEESPVVAILGARQVGKTTLARQVAARPDLGLPVHRFDLEDPRDLARLAEPGLALRRLTGLVVLDEVQRMPELFPLLRVLADRPEMPARFLLLGSATPALLRGASESLAGRIRFVPLDGFHLAEVRARAEGLPEALWLRGGFPRSFLAASDGASLRWRQDFIRTFVERDIPQLALGVAGTTIHRFWTMLAHNHGQVLNMAHRARSFGVSDPTVRAYVDALASTFVVRVLPPWHENVGKRQVKRPKVYLSDTGLLHGLLGLDSVFALQRHPILGASWEWFAIRELIFRLGARPEECYFWATHAGAELDLLVVRGNRRLGFEVTRTETPRTSRSTHSAIETLRLDTLDIVHAGAHTWPLGPKLRALSLRTLQDDLDPL